MPRAPRYTKASARSEISDLLYEAGQIELRLLAVKEDERRKEKIKDRLRELCGLYPDLWEQRTTLTKAVAAQPTAAGATVTFPETQYDVDHERFRNKVGDAIFHEVFRITKAELDMDRWARVVAEERATDRDMQECTVALPGRKPAVSIQAPVTVESVS